MIVNPNQIEAENDEGEGTTMQVIRGIQDIYFDSKTHEEFLKNDIEKWTSNWKIHVSSCPKEKRDSNLEGNVWDMVQNYGLRQLIFPVNIPSYHWFLLWLTLLIRKL
jgi:hypothetical protein